MKIAELCRHKIQNLFTEWKEDTVASEYIRYICLKEEIFFLENTMMSFVMLSNQ